MAWATVEDVVLRIGHELDDDTASAVTVFLEDFEVFVKIQARQSGTDVDDLDTSYLTVIAARRAIEWLETTERSGARSITQTVGDTSQSITYGASDDSGEWDDLFYLTSRERSLAGFKTPGIGSFKMVRTHGRHF